MGRTEIEAYTQNRSYTGVSNSERSTPDMPKIPDKEYDRKKLKELLNLEKKEKLDDNMKPYINFLENKET